MCMCVLIRNIVKMHEKKLRCNFTYTQLCRLACVFACVRECVYDCSCVTDHIDTSRKQVMMISSVVLCSSDSGDIGGSMGLLIGASVITLIEAIDAFVIAVANRRQIKRRQSQRSSQMEADTKI